MGSGLFPCSTPNVDDNVEGGGGCSKEVRGLNLKRQKGVCSCELQPPLGLLKIRSICGDVCGGHLGIRYVQSPFLPILVPFLSYQDWNWERQAI